MFLIQQTEKTNFPIEIVADFKPIVKNKLEEIQQEIKEQVKKVTGELENIDLKPSDIIPQTVFDISDKVVLVSLFKFPNPNGMIILNLTFF